MGMERVVSAVRRQRAAAVAAGSVLVRPALEFDAVGFRGLGGGAKRMAQLWPAPIRFAGQSRKRAEFKLSAPGRQLRHGKVHSVIALRQDNLITAAALRQRNITAPRRGSTTVLRSPMAVEEAVVVRRVAGGAPGGGGGGHRGR